MPPQAGMQSTKISLLFAVCTTQLLCHYLTPSGWALQIPPVIVMKWGPSGPPRTCSTMLEKLDVHLEFSFFHWESHRPSVGGTFGAVLCWPGGGVMWSKWSHSSYPFNLILLSVYGLVSREGASASLQMLGLSQWYLVYGELLAYLLLRWIEVRNNLHYHLNVTCQEEGFKNSDENGKLSHEDKKRLVESKVEGKCGKYDIYQEGRKWSKGSNCSTVADRKLEIMLQMKNWSPENSVPDPILWSNTGYAHHLTLLLRVNTESAGGFGTQI